MAQPKQAAAPPPPPKAPDENAAIAAIVAVNAGQKDYLARNRRFAPFLTASDAAAQGPDVMLTAAGG